MNENNEPGMFRRGPDLWEIAETTLELAFELLSAIADLWS